MNKKELDVMKDDFVPFITDNESESMWGVSLLAIVVIPVAIVALIWQII